ncbi:MAG: hypothetical protein A2882_00870 [Phenylobacterium sp. RIFCSPHIGHO2_01_FULL_70_10]|nr:MAG: hypothetical protein A2882_00870 [Phenylobacterium sp. RIFCSPHIGHO2_01_FULL_70_10]
MRLTRRALTGGLTLGLATTSLAVGRAWSAEPLAPEPAVIRGEAKAGGRTVAYRAVAAETVLPGPDGAPEATLFSTAYFAEGEDAAARPVTFFFNGGPGAATIDLREGLAPVHTRNAAGRGFRLADNPDTLIDASDLVFVDPGGIGYSRFLKPGVAARYWGVDEDARAVADFIAIWLKANGREASPKYLVGESYAGIRVGMVAERMARLPEPVRFDGVVLVSPSTGTRGAKDLAAAADPAVRALPSQAATALYYGKSAHAGAEPAVLAEAARGWAEGDYARALAKGETISPALSAKVARELSGYLGLPEAQVLAADLRIPMDRFIRELLAEREARIGLSDARAHAPYFVTDAQRPPYDDPSTSPYTLTYNLTEAVEHLYRQVFGYRPLGPYVRLSYEANGGWNHEVEGGPRAMPLVFKELMAADPDLRVSLMLGCYDLNIPYAGPLNEYLAADLPSDRFAHRLFEAGHSIFSDPVGRRQASADLRAFVQAG